MAKRLDAKVAILAVLVLVGLLSSAPALPATVNIPGGAAAWPVLAMGNDSGASGVTYTGTTRANAGAPIVLSAVIASAEGAPNDLARGSVTFDVTSPSGAKTSYGPLPVSPNGLAGQSISGGLSKGTYSVAVRVDGANGRVPSLPRTSGLVVSDPANALWVVQYAPGTPSPGYSQAPPYFQFWQQVRIENRGSAPVRNVVAYVDRVTANTDILDGQVTLGSIPAGESAWSSDTFKLSVNMSVPSGKCDGFSWRIEYDDGDRHHILTDIPQFPPGPAPGGCS